MSEADGHAPGVGETPREPYATGPVGDVVRPELLQSQPLIFPAPQQTNEERAATFARLRELTAGWSSGGWKFNRDELYEDV